ncbi:MAG: addiction module protein [Phycisphaerae bacterium]
MVKSDLVAEVLKLDPTEREYLRDVLNASLEKDVPCELTAEEQATILRRLEDYRKNPDSFLSWDQVKAQLAEQRNRKRA